MDSAEDEEYGFRRLEYDPRSPAADPPLFSSHSISMTPTKPSSRVLSFILQAIVMALVISLFFLFLGIASLILLHICIAGRALRGRRAARTGGDIPPRSAATTGLSPKDVQMLPSCNYDSRGPAVAASDCAVCLEGFKDGEQCRMLPPCGHVFHVQCVDRWLMKVSACPVCRAVVLGFPHGDEGEGLAV